MTPWAQRLGTGPGAGGLTLAGKMGGDIGQLWWWEVGSAGDEVGQ